MNCPCFLDRVQVVLKETPFPSFGEPPLPSRSLTLQSQAPCFALSLCRVSEHFSSWITILSLVSSRPTQQRRSYSLCTQYLAHSKPSEIFMKPCMIPSFLGEEDPFVIGPKYSSSHSTCLHQVLFGFSSNSFPSVSLECPSASSPIVSTVTLSMGA